MGISVSLEKLSACDVKFIQQERNSDFFIITTMRDNGNGKLPLIKGTLTPYAEEMEINRLINDKKNTKGIIIYGKNCQDTSVIDKYKQLMQLGLTNTFIYFGGIFEWLLLNDKYPAVFALDNSVNASAYNLWDFCGEPNKKISKTV